MARSERKRKQRGGVTRRDFIKQTAAASSVSLVASSSGAASLAETGPDAVTAEIGTAVQSAAQGHASSAVPSLHAGFPIGERNFARFQQVPSRPALKVPRNAIIFAIGDTLIPSAKDDPGYRDLEWYGITAEVSRRIEIADADLDHFNRAASSDRNFTDLTGAERAAFFDQVIQGTGTRDDAEKKKLKETYSHVREMVFTIYYQNFPEHSWPRDAHRVPLLKAGDTHQLTNPNTKNIVTGWDQAGYAGPLTWEEEERRRNFFKKIRWQE